MRLYHVSEESDIEVFHPRLPTREDLDPQTGLVWAVNDRCLPNFLTPRDCPRVAYHAGPEASEADVARFFSSPGCLHVVAVEHAWFDALRSTTLYLYGFAREGFTLQDEVAGYYVSTRTETPVTKVRLDDLPAALFARQVELRVVDSLWPLADAVRASTLRWSLCRMRNARPKA